MGVGNPCPWFVWGGLACDFSHAHFIIVVEKEEDECVLLLLFPE
jgi:hypothetical protein